MTFAEPSDNPSQSVVSRRCSKLGLRSKSNPRGGGAVRADQAVPQIGDAEIVNGEVVDDATLASATARANSALTASANENNYGDKHAEASEITGLEYQMVILPVSAFGDER